MKLIRFILPFMWLASCNVSLEPIHYGKESCDHCRMVIMDPKFGGEIITDKGKIYKFDSEECLIYFYKSHQNEQKHFTIIAVTDYSKPKTWIDIHKALFVQDEHFQSPMGANLAAFDARKEAENITGTTLKWMNWEEVLGVVK